MLPFYVHTRAHQLRIDNDRQRHRCRFSSLFNKARHCVCVCVCVCVCIEVCLRLKAFQVTQLWPMEVASRKREPAHCFALRCSCTVLQLLSPVCPVRVSVIGLAGLGGKMVPPQPLPAAQDWHLQPTTTTSGHSARQWFCTVFAAGRAGRTIIQLTLTFCHPGQPSSFCLPFVDVESGAANQVLLAVVAFGVWDLVGFDFRNGKN